MLISCFLWTVYLIGSGTASFGPEINIGIETLENLQSERGLLNKEMIETRSAINKLKGDSMLSRKKMHVLGETNRKLAFLTRGVPVSKAELDAYRGKEDDTIDIVNELNKNIGFTEVQVINKLETLIRQMIQDDLPVIIARDILAALEYKSRKRYVIKEDSLVDKTNLLKKLERRLEANSKEITDTAKNTLYALQTESLALSRTSEVSNVQLELSRLKKQVEGYIKNIKTPF